MVLTGTGTSTAPGATLSYAWAFGDGTTGTGASLSHVYTNDTPSDLIRTVTLTVGDGSASTATATRFITVNPAPDTEAPLVGAAESGTQGLITLSATASDNRGVSNVSFWVDGVQVGSDATSPYSLSLDSTTLINGSHSLVAKATDGTGNEGVSTPVAFTISHPVVATERILNGGFEAGAASWTQTTGVITSSSTQAAHGGTWKAWLGGKGTGNTSSAYQQVAIPSSATSATLSFWLHIDTTETTKTKPYDKLTVLVQNTAGRTLATLGTYSSLNKNTGFAQKTFSLLPYKGQTLRLKFNGVEDYSLRTSFVVDDVSLLVK